MTQTRTDFALGTCTAGGNVVEGDTAFTYIEATALTANGIRDIQKPFRGQRGHSLS